MTDKIKAGLQKLDSKNDAHWTQAGEPSLNILSIFAGEKVSREQATAAWPEFNRKFAADGGQGNVASTGSAEGATESGKAVDGAPGDAAPGVATAAQQENADAQATDGPAPSQVTTTPAVRPESLENDTANPTGIHYRENADGLKTLVAPGEKVADGARPSDAAVDLAQAAVDGTATAEARDDLSAQIEELEGDLERINKHLDEVNDAKAKINLQLDALRAQTNVNPRGGLSDSNSQYLAAQTKQREEKSGRLSELQDAGITRKMLDSVMPKPAPIDSALRNRQRK